MKSNGTNFSFDLAFVVDPIAQVLYLKFVGILDIIAEVGGLFSSMKIILVLLLSTLISNQYTENVAKRINKTNESYGVMPLRELIFNIKHRLTGEQLFLLFD